MSNMGSTRNADLPEEIKQEILLRLPVKSLCRFKCVCKKWCALIGSPSFVNQHLCHESNQERLLIRHDRRGIEEYAFALFNETCSRYESTDHLQLPKHVSHLLGPLNGVFWVIGCTDTRSTALLNPAMRQFKPMPLLPTYFPPKSFSYVSLSGFGVDPSTGDYKLVFIQFWRNGGLGRLQNTLASVCNSSSKSWRNLEDVDLVGIVCGDMLFDTYLNGIYYWLVDTELAGNYGTAILGFDMSSEKFQTIQIPDKSKKGRLTLCGDSLAYLTFEFLIDHGGYKIDVWMMKNDRCWMKDQRVVSFLGLSKPLGIFKEDEMLFKTGSYLVLCNLSTQKLRSVEFRWMYTRFRKQVISYKESLVSLKGEGHNCMLWDTSSELVKNIFKCPPWNSGCSWCR